MAEITDAVIKSLKNDDELTPKTIYPYTVGQAVLVNSQGRTLSTALTEVETDIDDIYTRLNNLGTGGLEQHDLYSDLPQIGDPQIVYMVNGDTEELNSLYYWDAAEMCYKIIETGEDAVVMVDVTMAEYEALSDEEKNNGLIYNVTDEDEDDESVIAEDSAKLGGQLPSYYASVDYVDEAIANSGSADVDIEQLASDFIQVEFTGVIDGETPEIDPVVQAAIDDVRGDLSNLSAEDVGARPNTWMPTASEVGARPDTWMPTASEVGAPTTAELDSVKNDLANHTHTASDVGARPSTWMPSASDVGALPSNNVLIFNNVTVNKSSIPLDINETYPDYPYIVPIPCPGVTADYYPEVVFDMSEATSGNYSPIAVSDVDKVRVYSKVSDTVTIASVKCVKAV